MATTIHPVGVPPPEGPSPTYSDSSLETRVASMEDGDISQRPRSRVRRTASRLLLRTSLRDCSSIATIVVGEANNRLRQETRYLVHKKLLTAASPFFDAALNSTFAEGMDQTVRLPEEKPDIFEWFLQWLYTGTLCICTSSLRQHEHGMEYGIDTDGELRNPQGSPKYFLLLDLYALSDRLLTIPLSNHILSTIARLSETTNSVPTPSDTWILYDTIRDTAPIRALVLDLFAYKKTDRLLETHKDDWHPRFLRELCVKLKRPGPEAIERHSLVTWRAATWPTTKACELCKDVLKPGVSVEMCEHCQKVFCAGCLRAGTGQHGNGSGNSRGVVLPLDTSGCKPWAGNGMCVRYHEHEGGEGCR